MRDRAQMTMPFEVKPREISMDLIASHTTHLTGQVQAPSSKSESIRGIFFASLASGFSTLHNVLEAEDTQDAIRVCRQLGARIHQDASTLQIHGIGAPGGLISLSPNQPFFSGNSGLTTHFLLPLLGLRQNAEQPLIVDCGEQMRARPIGLLVDALRALGMYIQYLNKPGFCPVLVSGILQGGEVCLETDSSQHISALLMALVYAKKNSVLIVKNLTSRPYLEMTLQWLKSQGITYQHQKNGTTDIFCVQVGQCYTGFDASITGDFSSMSCLIAAAAMIPSTVELLGLDLQSEQGDKRLLTILQSMGANLKLEPQRILIRGGSLLRAVQVDASDIPDLLPILAVIGTQAKGGMEIMNVQQARVKETDRIHSMVQGLRTLGARIDEQKAGVFVHPSTLMGSSVKGYGDHRTVMALAVASMLATGRTRITDAQAVSKTFPGFVSALRALGGAVFV